MFKYLEWYGKSIVRVFTVIFAVVSMFLFIVIPTLIVPIVVIVSVVEYGLPVIVVLLFSLPLVIKFYGWWLSDGNVVFDWLIDLLE